MPTSTHKNDYNTRSINTLHYINNTINNSVHQLKKNIIVKTAILSLSAFIALCGSAGAGAATISGILPGELETKLEGNALEETSLTLSGTIDVRDLITIASMPNLRELDLSEATIAAFTPDKPLPLADGQFDAGYLPKGIFFGKRLTAVALPATLKSIGSHALADNDFTSVALPEGILSIDDFAFYGCGKLASVAFPESLRELGEYSFASCAALTSADISRAGVKEIPANCFLSDAMLSELSLPGTLTEIGPDAFAGCTALKSVEFPSGISAIGAGAFALSGLEKLDLPSSVGEIGDFAFSRTDALREANLNSLPALGDGTFFSAPALSSITTSDPLTAIPDYTFTGNRSLAYAGTKAFASLETVGDYALMDGTAESITFGAVLSHMGDGAMEGFTGLKEIDAIALGTNVPSLGTDVFAGMDQASVEMTVAEDSGSVWKSAPQWKEFRIKEFSGIEGTTAGAEGIRAWFRGNELCVEAPREIEHINVYLPDGKELYRMEPRATSASIDTSGFAEHLYIVKVVTSDGGATFKLMR